MKKRVVSLKCILALALVIAFPCASAMMEDHPVNDELGNYILLDELLPRIGEDSDNDGVSDILDRCPNTPENSFVDSDGCDVFQFCKKFYCSMRCFTADWLGDEPNVTSPHDCTLRFRLNEGKYEPICLPEDCPEPFKDLAVPNGTVTATVHGGSDSYFSTELEDVPDGYGEIANGTYDGWCVQLDVYIVTGTPYTVLLISSYDPELANICPSCALIAWDKVNYILNHKNPNATPGDVQLAIWYFTRNMSLPSDPEALAMVNDAIAHGSGFKPAHGQYMAILVYAGSSTQLTIIEVDP